MRNLKTKNCKLYIIPFLLILFFSNIINAQKKIADETQQLIPSDYNNKVTSNLATDTRSTAVCNNSSEAYQKKYSQQSFYIPTKKDAVITLKITVHIFKPIEDVGRWQMNDNTINGKPALKILLDSITNGHQERYSAKRKATYEVKDFNSPYIFDSKIMFEITNVYFYSNAELYTSSNDDELFKCIEKTDSNRLKEGMPLVFNGGSGPGHLSGYKGSAALVTTLNSDDPVFGRSHLLHEIGHAFGLGHTYVNTMGAGSDWQNFNAACNSQDYLSDVFPNNNPACQNENGPTSKPNNTPCFSCYESTPDTSNNVMGGQRYNRWMSPLQMGRRIRSMHLNANNGHNLRQFAKDMESDHTNVWIISANEIWDFDIQLYKDILVKNGATLTIKCKTALAINGKIKLEKGANLVIDGGEVTGWCKSGKWQGIETPLQKNKITDQSVIKIINGGEIKNAKSKFKKN